MQTLVTFMTKAIAQEDTDKSEAVICWNYMALNLANMHCQKHIRMISQGIV
jgi:hypothetical protein